MKCLEKKVFILLKPKKGVVYCMLDLMSEPALSVVTIRIAKTNEATIIKMVLNEVGDTYEKKSKIIYKIILIIPFALLLLSIILTDVISFLDFTINNDHCSVFTNVTNIIN